MGDGPTARARPNLGVCILQADMLGSVSELPAEDTHEVIHLGDQTAVVVPLAEYRRLRALEQLADSEALVEAEAQAALADYQARKAAGTLGPGVPHDQVRRQFGLPAR